MNWKTLVLMSFICAGTASASVTEKVHGEAYGEEMSTAYEFANSLLENFQQNCESNDIDSQQMIRDLRRKGETSKAICEREIQKSQKALCKNRIAAFKQIRTLFTSNSARAIEGNLGGVSAPDDAVGAVQNWKARQMLEGLKHSELGILERVTKKNTCKDSTKYTREEVRNNIRIYDEVIRLSQRTTLRASSNSSSAQ